MIDKTLFEQKTDLYVNTNLGMYYCGKREHTPNHSYGPEIRNHFLFVLVNRGTAMLHHDSDILFREHDLLVMFPGEKIHYEALTPWSIQWVGLYGDGVLQYINQLEISAKNPIFHLTLWAELEIILEKMYLLSNNFSTSNKLTLTGLIYDFFSLLFQNSNLEEETDHIKTATTIIDYNFNNDLSIESLANDLHLSASYFSRLFKKELGISPKQYLLEQRIKRAKELLKTTNASVIEIANSVGIPDQLYFSRIFKKKVGISPLEYRQKYRT